LLDVLGSVVGDVQRSSDDVAKNHSLAHVGFQLDLRLIVLKIAPLRFDISNAK